MKLLFASLMLCAVSHASAQDWSMLEPEDAFATEPAFNWSMLPPDLKHVNPQLAVDPEFLAASAILNWMLLGEEDQFAAADQPGSATYLFTAKWCVPCNPVKAMLEEERKKGLTVKYLEKTPLGTSSVWIIDYDQSRGIANKYDIKHLPTFVQIRDGKETHRHVGALGRDDFLKFRAGTLMASMPVK